MLRAITGIKVKRIDLGLINDNLKLGKATQFGKLHADTLHVCADYFAFVLNGAILRIAAQHQTALTSRMNTFGNFIIYSDQCPGKRYVYYDASVIHPGKTQYAYRIAKNSKTLSFFFQWINPPQIIYFCIFLL